MTSPEGFDARREAKRLLRTVRAGALATLDGTGAPFTSLVSVATLVDGRPVLLLSRLAAHTRHLEVDARCSLLLAAGGRGDPLAHPRLTLGARAVPLAGADAATARERFLARQPKAKLYADFPDFAFWRLDLAGVHINGGFARAASFDGSELLVEPGPLAAAERGAVAHMNADHVEALVLYATALAGEAPGSWVASGLDPEGIDLICGDRVARLDFNRPVADTASLRRELIELARQARSVAVEDPP